MISYFILRKAVCHTLQWSLQTNLLDNLRLLAQTLQQQKCFAVDKAKPFNFTKSKWQVLTFSDEQACNERSRNFSPLYLE